MASGHVHNDSRENQTWTPACTTALEPFVLCGGKARSKTLRIAASPGRAPSPMNPHVCTPPMRVRVANNTRDMSDLFSPQSKHLPAAPVEFCFACRAGVRGEHGLRGVHLQHGCLVQLSHHQLDHFLADFEHRQRPQLKMARCGQRRIATSDASKPPLRGSGCKMTMDRTWWTQLH